MLDYCFFEGVVGVEVLTLAVLPATEALEGVGADEVVLSDGVERT